MEVIYVVTATILANRASQQHIFLAIWREWVNCEYNSVIMHLWKNSRGKVWNDGACVQPVSTVVPSRGQEVLLFTPSPRPWGPRCKLLFIEQSRTPKCTFFTLNCAPWVPRKQICDQIIWSSDLGLKLWTLPPDQSSSFSWTQCELQTDTESRI